MKTAVLCLTFLLLASCAGAEPIEQFNENTSLLLPLTLSESEVKLNNNEYQRVNGYGGYGYESENLFITIAGWPDVQDDYHVIRYRIKDATYHVFGISVGSSGEAAQKILTKNGYKLTEQTPSDWVYEKSDVVRITLCINGEGIVTEILVEAVTTNRDGIVF